MTTKKPADKATKKTATRGDKASPASERAKAADVAAAAARAAKASAAKSDGDSSDPAFTPVSDVEKLSAAGKLAIQRAEEAAQAEAEDVARAQSGETQSITQVELLITRDNSKATIQAFEYEQRVYEQLHGEENVDVLGTRVVQVLDWDPATAFDTMIRKFGKNGEKAVRAVYRDEVDLAREAGVRYTKSAADRKRDRGGNGSLVVDYSKPAAAQQIGRTRVARIVAA